MNSIWWGVLCGVAISAAMGVCVGILVLWAMRRDDRRWANWKRRHVGHRSPDADGAE